MSEFNKAATDVPSKRKRPDGGIVYENGREIGVQMYSMVTRDTAQGGMRPEAHHMAQMAHHADQGVDLHDNENSMRIDGHDDDINQHQKAQNELRYPSQAKAGVIHNAFRGGEYNDQTLFSRMQYGQHNHDER